MERRLKNEWEVSAYNRDTNEWDVRTNHSYEHTNDDVDLTELLVREAQPTRIVPSRRAIAQRADTRTLVAGDAQIPFQDENAFNLFQTAVSEGKPDNIVFVGDMVDLPSLSKFSQRNEWVGTTQSALDEYHRFLAQTRANAPNANIYVVHGNHEQRLDNYVQRNAAEVLGLRRANAGNELAVLSLQNLVRYEELSVESIDGYPNGTLWLEDNLKFIHGTNVAKGGSNAAKYLREERESTIYGHTHRMEVAYRTFAKKVGATTIAAASPGCLALIDGSVPGFRHTVNSQGEVVKHAEDWQQGLLVIDHKGENHNIVPVRFNENGFSLDGKIYNTQEEVQ